MLQLVDILAGGASARVKLQQRQWQSLHCTMPHYVALRCAVLHCTVPYCALPTCTTPEGVQANPGHPTPDWSRLYQTIRQTVPHYATLHSRLYQTVYCAAQAVEGVQANPGKDTEELVQWMVDKPGREPG